MNRAILFDLDGTLTDPRLGITRCIAYALDRMGAPSQTEEELCACIGPPLRGSFGRLIHSDDPDRIQEAMAHYRERFTDVGLFENELYEEIPETLAALQDSFELHVATSKPTVFAARIVEHFGLSHYFRSVVGSELDGRREAKADVIAHVLDTHGLSPERATMVGDRSHDVVGARHHGMPCLGVLYGYGSEAELREAGAASLARTPAEIATFFANIS